MLFLFQILRSFVLPSVVGAVLVISPRDTEATVNDSTYMNCSTSLSKSVQWHHGSYYVYTGEGILEPYNGRFAIEVRTRPHAYNLVIHSVQPQDAGEYECKDDEGFGESRSAHLIVIDDDPVCTSNIQPDGVVGSNSCGVEPDEVILSCSVTYYGNTPPIIEWRQLNGGSNQPVTQKVNTSTSANNLISTLTVNAGVDSSLNNSSFICQTTRDVGKHHSCSTGGIKILHVFSSNTTVRKTLDEEINCFANSNLVCTYEWKWFSGNESITASTNRRLTTTRFGQHRCEATCVIRNTPCVVTVMFAEVHSNELRPKPESLLPLLTLLALIPAVGFIIVLLFKKKKHTEANTTNDGYGLVPLQEQNGNRIHNGIQTVAFQV